MSTTKCICHKFTSLVFYHDKILRKFLIHRASLKESMAKIMSAASQMRLPFNIEVKKCIRNHQRRQYEL